MAPLSMILTVIHVAILHLLHVSGHGHQPHDIHNFDPAIHKVRISREEAFTFLETTERRIKRADAQCNTNEEYCEENRRSCMLHNENSREYFCSLPAKNPNCTTGQTCYLSTPCPVHYRLGCSDDPCDGIPCQNLGTCIKQASGYRCSCYLGFDEQNNCEKDCSPGPADVVFLLDTSESDIALFNKSRSFVYKLIQRLPINETDFRVAVITYSYSPEIEFLFRDNFSKDSLLDAVEGIEPKSGPTNTAKALAKAEEILKDSVSGSRFLRAYQYIIVVSDGLSSDRREAIKKAKNIESAGIKVYGLGVDRESDHLEFFNLASKTTHRNYHGVFSMGNDDLLHTLYVETVHKDCANCSLNSTTDIILAMDLSTLSQKTDDVQLIFSSIVELVSLLNTSSANISLGLVTFASSASLDVKLGEIADQHQFKSKIQDFQKRNEASNITAAFEVLKSSHAFSVSMGARRQSRKLVVLFSTGNWTNIPKATNQAQTLADDGITILFVAIGDNPNFTNFENVSTDDHNIYWIDSDERFIVFKTMLSKVVFVTCPPDFSF